MTTPQANTMRPHRRALPQDIASRISAFPTVSELQANPSLILDGGPFKPRWAQCAKLITKQHADHSKLFGRGDGDKAVLVTFKSQPEAKAVRIDFWHYAYLTALSLPGGSVYLNPANNHSQPYVRFRRAVLKIEEGRELDMGPVPVARLLLDLGSYEGATYADGNRFNLLPSNLLKEGFGRCDKSRASVELGQVKASGFNPQLKTLLQSIWEQGQQERQAPDNLN